MPRISVKFNDSTFQQIEHEAEKANLTPSFWVAQTVSRVLLGNPLSGGGKAQGGAPSEKATPSNEKRGPGRPALEKTAAQRRKEEALLSWKKSGPKGGLCPGSRQVGERDSGASGFKWDYGICPVCHVGFLKGIAQMGGGVMVQDHGDGVVPESNESLDPLPYGSTVPEEEAPEDEVDTSFISDLGERGR